MKSISVNNMDSITIGLLFVAIIGWGFWGFFQKIGVSKVGAEVCILLTASIELLVVISYLASIQKLHVPRSWSLTYPILAGTSVAIGTIAFLTALEKIPVSIARPMTGLSILATVLLGLVFLHEMLTIKHYLGIGMAIAAIVILSS